MAATLAGEAVPAGLYLTPAQPALSLRGVEKTFVDHQRNVAALGPIGFDVAPGEFVCLLGPSGCGKSTLLGLVAGLERPTAGEVLVHGRPVVGTGTDRVLLFQDAALFPWLDVRGNVEFGLRRAGVGAAERRRIVDRLLGLVRLERFDRHYVHQLSGGMRQRVALARALAIDPQILLMDEPFGALDALTRERMYAELEAIWRSTRKTILFVTHNVREALALGDRIFVLSARPGRIVGEFPVRLPRPRSLENHALVDQAAEIVRVLRTGAEAEQEVA